MSELIPLDVAMAHLYAEVDDKEQVARKLTSAVAIAEQYMGRKIYSTFGELQDAQMDAALQRKNLIGEDEFTQNQLNTLQMQMRGVVITADIEAAILLILGVLYAHREGIGEGMIELPMPAKFFLQPYRVMGV